MYHKKRVWEEPGKREKLIEKQEKQLRNIKVLKKRVKVLP
jgi:hypothetical protein